MICYIYIYISMIFHSLYGEWKLVKSPFSQLVLDVIIFKRIWSHLKNESDLLIIYLTSLIGIAAVES